MIFSCEPIIATPNEPELPQFSVIDSTDTIAPSFPEITLSSPDFPAPAVHIIWREFLYQDTAGFKGQPHSWPNYLDTRLNELYPSIAYPGVVNDATTEFNQFKDSFYAHEQAFYEWEDFWGTPTDTTSSPPAYTDFEAEIALMDLDGEYITTWTSIDSIVLADTVMSTNDVNTFVYGPGSYKRISGILKIALAGAAYYTYRAWAAKKKSFYAANEKYKNDLEEYKGMRQDAYRYILASTLSRKWTNRPWAAFVGLANELKNTSNTNADKYMDYHNNHVGRVTKYQDFKSGSHSDIQNTIKAWVDDFSSSTSQFVNMAQPVPDWNPNDPSKKSAQDYVNNKKYDKKYVVYE
ncbi:MAG: hypothetical protein KDC92_07815 [Bacteroidetes bacterium]|nr:hypothetical protein [Bacteroidota bacterium]